MRNIIIALFATVFLNACVFIPDPFTRNTDHTQNSRGQSAFETGNYVVAEKHLIPCAEQGDIDSQYILGLIYLYGLTGEKQPFLAQKYLIEAANNGHYAAQEQLAFIYADQYQPMYNPIDAYHWYSVIIEQKPQYAQQMEMLRQNLLRQGVLTKAEKMPSPKSVHYKGVDYNAMFPYR